MKAYKEDIEAQSDGFEVLITGHIDSGLSMTPDGARDLAKQLIVAADRAEHDCIAYELSSNRRIDY